MENDIKEILAQISGIIGKPAWGANIHHGIISLQFGEPQPPNELGHVRGEWGLFTNRVSWRLDGKDKMLAGYEDPNDFAEEKFIKWVDGKKLEEIVIEKSALDTRFIFEDQITLRLFSKIKGTEDYSWVLFMPESRTFSIGPGTQWEVEQTPPPFYSRKRKKRLNKLVNTQEIQSTFESILNKPIWGVRLSSHYKLTLEIGDKIHNSKGQQIGEWRFGANYACWRFEKEKEMLVGSSDEEESIFSEVIQQLEGSTITSVTVLNPAYDLIIEFNNQIQLYIFPITSIDDQFLNWWLYTPDSHKLFVYANRARLIELPKKREQSKTVS